MRPLPPFKLERYFAHHEFTSPHLLSPSDCESLSLTELLAYADAELLAQWEGLGLGYTTTRGHPELLQSVCQLYEGIETEHILGVIPQEGIFLIMQAALSPGDHVVTVFPAFQSLHAVAGSLGCEVTHWTPEPGSQWRFEVDALLAQLRPHTRLIVMNFPHNPTGAMLTPSDLTRLLGEAKERGITVFCDEIFRYSEYAEADRLPSVCELSEKAVILGGLSKSFGLPGLRVGWLATRDQDLMQRLIRVKDYTTICASAPSEVLGLMAVRARTRILARTRAILSSNLTLLDDFFSRHRERFVWRRPQAGPVAFVELQPPLQVERLARELLEQQGAMIASGSLFDFPGQFFRMGFGRRNFPQALERLEHYLQHNWS